MFQECFKGVKKKISKVCQVSRGYHASFEGVLRRFKFFHGASRKFKGVQERFKEVLFHNFVVVQP